MEQSVPLPEELILKTALLAGKILTQSGSETARVEDTMKHILRTALEGTPQKDYDIYVMLNGIFVRIGSFHTSFTQVVSRGNNLGRVALVNQISRDYAGGKITLPETYAQLCQIETQPPDPFTRSRLMAAALLGGSVVFLFGGQLVDVFPAFCSGLLTYVVYHLTNKFLDVPFASEFLSTLFGGLLGYGLSKVFGANLAMVTIGTVVPLVPGVAIANATRDLMERHYLTGVLRLVECICVGAALGGGIALVYFLLERVA